MGPESSTMAKNWVNMWQFEVNVCISVVSLRKKVPPEVAKWCNMLGKNKVDGCKWCRFVGFAVFVVLDAFLTLDASDGTVLPSLDYLPYFCGQSSFWVLSPCINHYFCIILYNDILASLRLFYHHPEQCCCGSKLDRVWSIRASGINSHPKKVEMVMEPHLKIKY